MTSLDPNELRLNTLLGYLPHIDHLREQISFSESHPFPYLKDASDISINDWILIAKEIEKEYEKYDGFIILHSTDTMAYTASALSFIFENLSKPVVITGAPLPISNTHSDAKTNLVTSIMIAAYQVFNLPRIPEVIIYFDNKILRGNRTTKISRSDYAGFDSPGFQPLGTTDLTIKIHEKLLLPIPDNNLKPFRINSNIDDSIMAIQIYPGIKTDFLKKLLSEPTLKGFILITSGLLNMPGQDEFLNIIRKAVDNGRIIINVHTPVRPIDPIFELLLKASSLSPYLIDGRDMTSETALVKLCVALGLGLDIQFTRQLIQYNWRGEQVSTKGNIEDIYVSPVLKRESISIVNEVNIELIRYLNKHPDGIYNLSPRKLESLVADIFKHFGCNVTLTPETRDGGFDFSALLVDPMGIPLLTYVEVKKYSPTRPVGVNIVRNLYGVVAHDDISRGVIVTTSRFTQDAEKFSKSTGHRISLRDYNDITRWLKDIYE